MNKFYLNAYKSYYNDNILDVYVHNYNEPDDRINRYHWVVEEDQDIFYSMCKTPVLSLLYINHSNRHICGLAKLIITCKEPVAIMKKENGWIGLYE